MSETVQAYLDRFGLQAKMEDVINICAKTRPDEPMSFMVKIAIAAEMRSPASNFAIDPVNGI